MPNGNGYVSDVPTNRSFAQGTNVSLQGAFSGRTNGKITKSSVTITYNDGTRLRDLVEANYTVRRGDSGGGIFGTTNNVVHGLQSGATFTSSTAVTSNKAYFVKFDNISF